MIKALIFDLWETLGTKNVPISKTLAEHFRIEKTPQYLREYEEAIQLRQWPSYQEMGTNFLRYFSKEITADNIKYIENIVRSGIENATLFPGIMDFLVQLKKKNKLGLLSNTTSFETQAVERLGFSRMFDAIVYSWQLGSLKPAKENFNAIIEKLGVSPEECIYIDDAEKNLGTPKSMGMSTILFKNFNQLKQDLIALDIEI